MSFRNIVSILTTCAILTACATAIHLQRPQIDSLTKESTPSEIDRIISNATVVTKTEVSVDGKSYLSRHYRLLTGTKQEMAMVCTPTCIPIFVTVPVTSDYVVIQRLPSRELHAWGTLEELSKDSDLAVSSIMPVIKERFEETRKRK